MTSRAIRALAFRFLAMLDRLVPSNGVPIALYHQVSRTPTDYSIGGHVSPQVFREQMRRLAERGYRGVSMEEYRALRRRGEHPLPKIMGITFDDGQVDVYTQAFPALRELGFSATVFIVTDYVGQEKWLDPDTLTWSDVRPHAGALYYRFMSWSQIAEMTGAGFEFGSHSCSHPSLTGLPPRDMRDEIETSKASLERALGKSVTTFCYPFGRFNDAVRRTVVEVGYRQACSTIHGLNTPGTDPFALHRYAIASITGGAFDVYLTDKYQWYYRQSRRRRG